MLSLSRSLGDRSPSVASPVATDRAGLVTPSLSDTLRRTSLTASFANSGTGSQPGGCAIRTRGSPGAVPGSSIQRSECSCSHVWALYPDPGAFGSAEPDECADGS